MRRRSLGRPRGTLPIFLSDVKARHDRMVEFARRTSSAGRDRERLTAHGPQLTATQSAIPDARAEGRRLTAPDEGGERSPGFGHPSSKTIVRTAPGHWGQGYE